MSALQRSFNVRSNNVFFGTFGARLMDAMRAGAPGCTLRFVPEGVGDDDALREGRIDLYIASRRNFGLEIKMQSLFTTRFCCLAREGHPIFEAPITPERFAAFDHVSVSRRGRAHGPIDPALAALGLQRRVALITPHFHSAIFGVADSDLLLPLPKPVIWGMQGLGLRMRAFEVPLVLEEVTVIQAWHPRFDKDPAHRWLRQTLKRICEVLPADH